MPCARQSGQSPAHHRVRRASRPTLPCALRRCRRGWSCDARHSACRWQACRSGSRDRPGDRFFQTPSRDVRRSRWPLAGQDVVHWRKRQEGSGAGRWQGYGGALRLLSRVVAEPAMALFARLPHRAPEKQRRPPRRGQTAPFTRLGVCQRPVDPLGVPQPVGPSYPTPALHKLVPQVPLDPTVTSFSPTPWLVQMPAAAWGWML